MSDSLEHITTDELAAFVARVTTTDESRVIATHLSQCEICSETYLATLRTEPSQDGAPRSYEISRRHKRAAKEIAGGTGRLALYQRGISRRALPAIGALVLLVAVVLGRPLA